MFTGTKLTTKGSELIAYLHANNLPLILTNMRLGDGVSETFDLSELVSEKMQTQIEYITQQGTASVIRATFTNENLQSGFHVREVGIFALGENNEEVLYAYDNAGNGSVDYFESGTSNVIYKEVFEIATTISNAVDVQLQIEPKYVFVTEEQFEELKEETQKKVENTGVYTPNKLYSRNDIFKYNGNMYLTETAFTGDVVPDFSKVYMLSKRKNYDHFTIEIDTKNYSNPTKDNGGIKYYGGCEGFSIDDWVSWIGYRPCILSSQGNVITYLDENNYAKDINGNDVDITSFTAARNVMIRFPRIGYLGFNDYSNRKCTIHVTNDMNAIGYNYKAFNKNKRKSKDFFVGAYQGSISNSKLFSVSGAQRVTSGYSLSTFRTLAQAQGKNYGLLDHNKLSLFKILYIVQNGIINGKVSKGIGTNTTTGFLNESGMNVFDSTQYSRKWLGMESNCDWEFVDGCGLDSNLHLRISDNTNYSNTITNYDDYGIVYTLGSGYIGSSFLIDDEIGITSENFDGTASTYLHCPTTTKVANTIELQGGSNVFEEKFAYSSTSTSFDASARLCFMN